MADPHPFKVFKENARNYFKTLNPDKSFAPFAPGTKGRNILASKFSDIKGQEARRLVLAEALKAVHYNAKPPTDSDIRTFPKGLGHADRYFAYYYFLHLTDPGTSELAAVDAAVLGAPTTYPEIRLQYVDGTVFTPPLDGNPDQQVPNKVEQFYDQKYREVKKKGLKKTALITAILVPLCAFFLIISLPSTKLTGQVSYSVKLINENGSVGIKDVGSGYNFLPNQTIELHFMLKETPFSYQATLYGLVSEEGHAKIVQSFDLKPGADTQILVEPLSSVLTSPINALALQVRSCGNICSFIWRHRTKETFFPNELNVLPGETFQLKDNTSALLKFELFER